MIEALHEDAIVGIDLGTTNSGVAFVRDGRPEMVMVEGQAFLPSAVGTDTQGKLLVGEAALNQLLFAPERTARSIKRKMGTSEKVSLGGDAYTPREISAVILRRLKELAEDRLQRSVHKAVITVPAYFNETQRRATREAGELAGLEVVRLLHEPTAAALVYEADRYRGEPTGKPRRLLVYDMGGGTFDVSIVEIDGGIVEVKASHGDTHLGGDDFDELLLQHVASRHREEDGGEDLLARPRIRERLRRGLEKAKHELSNRPYARLEEEFLEQGDGKPLHVSMELERTKYEELIRPLIERSMTSVQTALRDAGLLARELDEILLVGGATRTPLIQRELRERTGIDPRFEVDPDLCVALGAANQAALIAGDDVRSVLVDITPRSFGIRTLRLTEEGPDFGHFSPVIAKGTALPASASKVYYTVVDEQEQVLIEVFQGDQAQVEENTKLGNFHIEELEPRPAEDTIVVDFDLSVDGTLEVRATQKASGVQGSVRITEALDSFDEEERAAAHGRLARLFGGDLEASSPPVSGDDPAPPRLAGLPGPGVPAGPEPGGEAEAILTTTRRLEGRLDGMVEDDREEARALIARAREHLAQGEVENARKVQSEMEDILFYVEES